MLTLIRCPFHSPVTAVARKRPRSFCQKCRCQVTGKHAYTFDPKRLEGLTMLSRYSAESYQENEITRNLLGNPCHEGTLVR